ncbi:hypothetical protein BHE74_00056338 [Ensete ventricosum]|nr:hypothetical protein BHE74_00056338 [Ensete ventricosum]
MANNCREPSTYPIYESSTCKSRTSKKCLPLIEMHIYKRRRSQDYAKCGQDPRLRFRLHTKYSFRLTKKEKRRTWPELQKYDKRTLESFLGRNGLVKLLTSLHGHHVVLRLLGEQIAIHIQVGVLSLKTYQSDPVPILVGQLTHPTQPPFKPDQLLVVCDAFARQLGLEGLILFHYF